MTLERNIVLALVFGVFCWWFFTTVKDVREATDVTRVADCTGQRPTTAKVDEFLWQFDF